MKRDRKLLQPRIWILLLIGAFTLAAAMISLWTDPGLRTIEKAAHSGIILFSVTTLYFMLTAR